MAVFIVGFPDNLFLDRKIPPIRLVEILRHEAWVSTSKIGEGICQVFSGKDLSVWVRYLKKKFYVPDA